MLRQEFDREDLMREATALHERAEFRVPGEREAVVAGYRRDGSLSIYFGPDPCYHFDSELRLRRAFVSDQLYRSQGTTLARLARVRTAGAVELQRRDLTAMECAEFLDQATSRLRHLHAALRQKQAVCLRTQPEDAGQWKRLEVSLAEVLQNPLVLAPAIRGRR